jgi:hypothetical protein
VKDKVIECTNCGGGNDLQFWITVGALVIAFLALLMNFVQFREFLRRSRARARFALTLTAANAGADGVVRTAGNHMSLRMEVGIDNEGDLAAGETLINVMFPRSLEVVGWCGPNGQETERFGSSIAQTGETLEAADGTEVEANYLMKVVDRVGTKPGHVFNFMCFVDVPDVGRREIPFRLKVQADEIPSDIDEYVIDRIVGIEHQDVN